MKTFDPPTKSSESHVETASDYLQMCTRSYPAARRTALLSLVPGLGQLKNGEIAKGILFLSISLANVVTVAAVCMGHTLAPSLSQLAACFQRQPNWSLAQPLQSSLIQSPALFLYIGLVLCFVAYAVRDAYDHAVYIARDGITMPKARLTLPEATSGSYLFHYTVFACFVLAVILFVTPQAPKQQVTTIELVPPQHEHKDAPKPSPPKRAEKPKEIIKPQPIIEPKPVVQKPVEHPKVTKVEPPKPTPVAVAVPTTDPTPLSVAPVESAAPVASAPAPSSSPTGTGAGGESGTGNGGKDQEVDMGPYMRELQRRIKAHWFPPKGNEDKRIKVSFKVFKDGHIARLRLVSSSGVQVADDAATQAVDDAGKEGFGPLPDGAGDDVDINFTFDYHVFGSGRRSHAF